MEKKIFKVLLLIVFAYLIFGQPFTQKEGNSSSHFCVKLENGWEWVHDDGTTEYVEFPGRYPVERGECMRIRRKLPEYIDNNNYLMFYSSRQDVRVYIDDELRMDYSTKNTRLFGTTSPGYCIFISTLAEDAEKEIVLELTTDSKYSGTLVNMYYGDRIGLVGRLFAQNGPDLIVAVIMLLFGLITLVASLLLHRIYKNRLALEYLSWCICMTAIWLILNSMFRQFLFRNISNASDVTYLFVFLLPLPFLIYMNELQRNRYRRAYLVVEYVLMVNTIVCSALHVIGTYDFSDSITLAIAVYIFSIVLIASTVFMDIYEKKIQEYLIQAVGLLAVCAAGGIQCLMYVTQYRGTLSGVVVALGMMLLLILSVLSTIRELLQLNEDKQRAEQASQTKAQFLANMSHEIRTPINAVLGMDEMILRESTQQEVLEYATDIQNAGKSLLSIINDILDFSKAESGKMEIIPAEYSLEELVRDSYHLVSVRAKNKGLEFIVKNNPDLPTVLCGDEIRIRQIIVNFLTNAVKYTEQGGITLVVDGRPSQNPQDKDIWDMKFTVRDTGTGIREANLEHLFDAFERVEEEKNRNIEGTGLGLALSKRLAEMMDGELVVESTYGKGSSFSVTIPQRLIDKTPVGKLYVDDLGGKVAKPKLSKLYAPEAQILVVDDVAVNLKVFTSLLKNSGMRIDTADSGEHCLQKVKNVKYDIIFLDHMMPGMNGMETMEQMRQIPNSPNARTPVIMLTANAISGAKERYLAAGFSDYLSKPVQVEEMEEMILQYLPHGVKMNP